VFVLGAEENLLSVKANMDDSLDVPIIHNVNLPCHYNKNNNNMKQSPCKVEYQLFARGLTFYQSNFDL
jgi:hypothetical protein